MSKISTKIKNFFDFPDLELSPEKKDEMIEKAARFIVDKGLGTPAIMSLDVIKPFSYIGSQMGLFFGSAFFPLIPGNWGSNIVAFLEEKENVEQLIQRVEVLMKEEDEAKKLEKQKPESKRSLRNLFKLDL